MGEDFLCTYTPRGEAVIEPLSDRGRTIAWSAGAEARLANVPSFVRRFVRQRAEAHAREVGEAVVSADHLVALARRRFGDEPPWRRQGAR